ncbi:hypothetical protein FF17_14415 [Bacillus subtilis]|nr:hypothetical protein M036_13115 [Bacillus subtilis TO-A]AJO59065.1 hypothetical protein QF06_11495 [Bacillus sp. YP1]AMR46383.1 hypothetical protein KHRBS_07685 [Bacillus subtilis subsp. subtilis]EXF54462.1 hypothetical protein Y647_07710 [Bacillus subtilis QH-1]KDE21951.1 hypothetical protein EF83_20400 [Bacillus subtilis]KMY47456.1 hypothetical protein AC621_04795 [Bacillus sp. FJAT-27445]GIN79869.1 hypothetical protein J5TS4_04470 [Bacillus sp. J5TS4]
MKLKADYFLKSQSLSQLLNIHLQISGDNGKIDIFGWTGAEHPIVTVEVSTDGGDPADLSDIAVD